MELKRCAADGSVQVAQGFLGGRGGRCSVSGNQLTQPLTNRERAGDVGFGDPVTPAQEATTAQPGFERGATGQQVRTPILDQIEVAVEERLQQRELSRRRRPATRLGRLLLPAPDAVIDGDSNPESLTIKRQWMVRITPRDEAGDAGSFRINLPRRPDLRAGRPP